MKSRRSGFTLVELLMAMLVGGTIVTIAYEVLISGNRMFSTGLSTAYGQQGAMLFFETLESDLLACVVIPGHEGDPVAIGGTGSGAGRSISFYRTDHALSTMQVTAASPVRYALVETDQRVISPTKNKRFHPTRNGVPMKQVVMDSLSFKLIPPASEEELEKGGGSPGWFVLVEAVFPERGIGSQALTVKRLIELDQPTQSAKYYEAFMGEVSPLSFLLSSGDPLALEELETVGLGPGAGPPPVEPEMPPELPEAGGATGPLVAPTGGK